MIRVLVSACLMGASCRYDGRSNEREAVLALLDDPRIQLVPVCPEQLGGLPTPRIPSECLGDQVINRAGENVTAQFERGAAQALHLCRLYGCQAALLKEKSPSCGHGWIYDGSFSHTLVPGNGRTAQLLEAEKIPIFGESQTQQLERYLASVHSL